jgi:hypothetical protein
MTYVYEQHEYEAVRLDPKNACHLKKLVPMLCKGTKEISATIYIAI